MLKEIHIYVTLSNVFRRCRNTQILNKINLLKIHTLNIKLAVNKEDKTVWLSCIDRLVVARCYNLFLLAIQ